MAFSPDGRVLATGGSDRSIHLWNTDDGRLLHKIAGNVGLIKSLVFSRDGKTLIALNGDGAVTLWDVASGKLRATAFFWTRRSAPAVQAVLQGSRYESAAPAPPASMLWLCYTPEGFYEASPGAEGFVRWRVGRSLYPASKYRARFYRRGLMRSLLGAAR